MAYKNSQDLTMTRIFVGEKLQVIKLATENSIVIGIFPSFHTSFPTAIFPKVVRARDCLVKE